MGPLVPVIKSVDSGFLGAFQLISVQEQNRGACQADAPYQYVFSLLPSKVSKGEGAARNFSQAPLPHIGATLAWPLGGTKVVLVAASKVPRT